MISFDAACALRLVIYFLVFFFFFFSGVRRGGLRTAWQGCQEALEFFCFFFSFCTNSQSENMERASSGFFYRHRSSNTEHAHWSGRGPSACISQA